MNKNSPFDVSTFLCSCCLRQVFWGFFFLFGLESHDYVHHRRKIHHLTSLVGRHLLADSKIDCSLPFSPFSSSFPGRQISTPSCLFPFLQRRESRLSVTPPSFQASADSAFLLSLSCSIFWVQHKRSNTNVQHKRYYAVASKPMFADGKILREEERCVKD